MKNSVVFFLLITIGCNKNQDIIKPSLHAITESVYASGIIKSKNQYKVFSTVTGIVQQVLVSENDVVKIGSPLFRIANESQQLLENNALLSFNFNDTLFNSNKLQTAKSYIDLSKQKLYNDELMYHRQLNLWNQEIGTKVELEQRRLSLESSQTNYISATQNYDDLHKQLNYLSKQSKNNLRISNKNTNDFIIKSSITGKVYQLNYMKGELVSHQTPLAIIGDDKTFILEMQVDEYDIFSIKNGMKILVVLNSYKDSVFEARVTKINPILNAHSKSFTIEAVFTKIPQTLYPYMSFEANIIIKTKPSALLIPRNYLLNDTEVLLKSGEKRKIKTGLKDLQMVEIISGVDIKDELLMPTQ